MVTISNFVTGPFLDLFGATVYDHLNTDLILKKTEIRTGESAGLSF